MRGLGTVARLAALLGTSLEASFDVERPIVRYHRRRRSSSAAIVDMVGGTSKLLPPAPPEPLSKRARRRMRGKAKRERQA